MTWPECEAQLRPCECGCPTVRIYADGGCNEMAYANCPACGKMSESFYEPIEVRDDWNLRGGDCVECDEKCESPEDELCPYCFQIGRAQGVVADKVCKCSHTLDQHNDVGGATDYNIGACGYCSCARFQRERIDNNAM